MATDITPIVKENINEEVIIKLSKYTYLEYQLRHKKISEEVIERYYNHFKDKFIKNQEDIFWGYVSAYQVLSEKFMEKYADKIKWRKISENQDLSKDFILKHSKSFFNII
jgi:ribosomal protein S17E